MTEPGLRERKKQQTWLALHRAALRLATAHGVAEVTTEHIATAAGVSPRTFFNYFPTKEAALVGLRPDRMSPMIRTLQELDPALPPVEAMFITCRTLLDDFTDDPDLWRQRRELLAADASLLRLASARNLDTEHRLVDIMADRLGCAADADPYPALVVGATMAALRTTIQFHGRHASTEAPETTLRRAFDLLEAGLPVPEMFGE